MNVETKSVLDVELGELYLTIAKKTPIVRLVQYDKLNIDKLWYMDSYNKYWHADWLICKIPSNNHLIKLLRIP